MAQGSTCKKGQLTMAGSDPVVIASDQSNIPVTQKAATSTSGTLQTAAAATGNGSNLSVDGMSSAILTVSGTFVGTVTFEVTEDGTNWYGIIATAVATGIKSYTSTAPGLYEFSVAGFVNLRARVSAYTSGSITV